MSKSNWPHTNGIDPADMSAIELQGAYYKVRDDRRLLLEALHCISGRMQMEQSESGDLSSNERDCLAIAQTAMCATGEAE